jgi:hypothetical protein
MQVTISALPTSVAAQARSPAPPTADEARLQRKVAAPPAPAGPEKTTASPQLIATRSIVELDVAAGRYVQTHINATDDSIISRYPSESQLSFSRGVNAYFRATQLA